MAGACDGKRYRHATQDLSHRRDHLVAQVGAGDRPIGALLTKKLERGTHRRGRAKHLKAALLQHRGQLHGDEELVLNNKDQTSHPVQGRRRRFAGHE